MSIKPVDTKDIAPTVAIVGGGASGTLLAAHLLRSGNARVLLIERGDRVGRGVAYGTSFEGHLLNVPAASMSGLPGDPEHFVRYLREYYDASVQPTTFVPGSPTAPTSSSCCARANGSPRPARRWCTGRATSSTSPRATAPGPGC